jgi:GT2 family glycosyltransferase
MLFIDNSIKKFLNFYLTWERKLKIGVLGCKLIDVNGNTNNSGGGFPWVKNDLKEIYIMIAEKILKKEFPPRDYYDFSKNFFEINYVVGADMFMRKSLFDVNKGFDPNYFMYYEESDLQMKIRKLGYNNYIFTDTSIIHFEGASSILNQESKLSNKKRIIQTISRNYYFKKNDAKNYPLHIIFDFLLSIRRIFNNKYTMRDNWQYFIENLKSY